MNGQAEGVRKCVNCDKVFITSNRESASTQAVVGASATPHFLCDVACASSLSRTSDARVHKGRAPRCPRTVGNALRVPRCTTAPRRASASRSPEG